MHSIGSLFTVGHRAMHSIGSLFTIGRRARFADVNTSTFTIFIEKVNDVI